MNVKQVNMPNCYQQNIRQVDGFSLIELIVVIVILGVLSTGISTFINFGTQVYTDATDREKIISSARFAIERLNREIRTALPNSIRITHNNLTGETTAKQCIEFTPIVLSTIYTDIPVAPEPNSNEIKVIAFDETLFDSGFNFVSPPNLNVGVYILDSDIADFYDGTSNKVFTLLNNTIAKSDNEWTLTLDTSGIFPENSPTERLYFFNHSVSYCVENSKLTRHQNYNRNTNNTPDSTGVLMAEDITMHDGLTLISPFKLTEPTQLRNSMVLIKLAFTKNNELVAFNNEIQVPNVP